MHYSIPTIISMNEYWIYNHWFLDLHIYTIYKQTSQIIILYLPFLVQEINFSFVWWIHKQNQTHIYIIINISLAPNQLTFRTNYKRLEINWKEKQSTNKFFLYSKKNYIFILLKKKEFWQQKHWKVQSKFKNHSIDHFWDNLNCFQNYYHDSLNIYKSNLNGLSLITRKKVNYLTIIYCK